MYGFTGTDAQNLAAVHLPPSAFENSTLYNVLNNAAVIWAGLDMLPQDQSFHPYVLVTTLGMMNSAYQHTLVLPMEWHQDLAEHFPHGINLKSFYNCFLSTVGVGEHQTLDGVFTWWRHAALRTANTAGMCSGLQVVTQQAVSPMVRSMHDAWAHGEAYKILEPLWQALLHCPTHHLRPP